MESQVTTTAAIVPEPAVVYARIGHLLRELRVARQLYKLSDRVHRGEVSSTPSANLTTADAATTGAATRG